MAAGPSGAFAAWHDAPAAQSPHGAGGLRYLSAVRLPDRRSRIYYEGTRADGAHELRTEVVSALPLGDRAAA